MYGLVHGVQQTLNGTFQYNLGTVSPIGMYAWIYAQCLSVCQFVCMCVHIVGTHVDMFVFLAPKCCISLVPQPDCVFIFK